MLDNIDNFYYTLLKQGYYLPKIKSRAITFDHLWKLFTNKLSFAFINDIKQGIVFRKVSKIELFTQLE